MVLYDPQWQLDFLVSLAIDMCQVGRPISQAKRVVCPCGRLKTLYLLLGKWVD